MKSNLFTTILLSLTISIFAQNSTNIKHTIITPHLNLEINDSINIVYCSTFQCAWNSLKDEVGGDIVFSKELPLSDYLNNGPNVENSLNVKDYLTKSGKGTNIFIDDLNKTINNKFNGVFEELNYQPTEDCYVIYSFLFKKMKFKKPFETCFINFKYESGKQKLRINAFGIKFKREKDQRKEDKKRDILLKQIEVYIFPNDFSQYLVKIKTNNPNEELILAKINPKLSYNETIKNVLSFRDGLRPSNEYRICQFAVPKINIDIPNYNYEELINKTIINKGVNYPIIKEANQSVFFKLDEKGVELKSKSKISSSRSVSRIDQTCHKLIFDEAFMLILIEKDSEDPYFIAWVANPEILE